MERHDIVVVGNGAGTHALLHSLAGTGLRILVLEHAPLREPRGSTARNGLVDSGAEATEEAVDAPLHGAAAFRFRERDFERVDHLGGVSPEWPLKYRDFEPWYTAAERLLRVRGERGADPTEPWSSAPYPLPRVEHEPRIQQLHDDLTRVGLRPFHVPRSWEPSRRLGDANSRAARAPHDELAGRARADVTFLQDANVTRLITNGSGTHVTTVVVERSGAIEHHAAGVVVLAGGAVRSAALLLRSANDRHPRGLANRSGVVGCHLMCHNSSIVLAVSRQPNPTVCQETIAWHDHYFEGPDAPQPLGHVSMGGRSARPAPQADAPSFAPGSMLENIARHSLDFWLVSEDLPRPDNRLRVDPDGHIVFEYTENNLQAHAGLRRALKATLDRIADSSGRSPEKSILLGKKIPFARAARSCGTLRFGTDSATSALDVHCKAHDVDNLYVVDGSFFVSSAAVDPTLTIAANALRVGGHLRERLGVGSTALAAAAG